MSFLSRAILAFGSGVLFAAAAPPIDLHIGILVGLVGHALALHPRGEPLERRRFSAALGGLFGLGANLVALRFVPAVVVRFTPLPVPAAWLALFLLAAAQALPWAIGGLVTHELGRRAPRIPVWLAYAIGVYAATFVPAVFPWTPAAGLAAWPALLQIADTVGERGTSFVLAIASGLVAHAVVHRQKPRAAATLLALALGTLTAMLGWGVLRMRSIERAREAAPHARIVLVQPGFDASARWDATRATMMIERLTSLTKSAELRGADLTIWPESAYPFTLPHSTRTSPSGARAVLQAGVHGPVLTGAYMSGTKGLGYNSAILVTPDGTIMPPYDKRHLLWFGEAVPLADWFPWLRQVFAKGTGLVAGHESVALVSGPIRAAVLNCYEDTLPGAGREAMQTSPNVLVNITNDAWFEGSAEGELHLRLAVLRAIETRRDLVRAVNKGPTSFIDASGRIRARYDLPMPGTLPTQPALLEGSPSFYVRFGDLPLLALTAGCILLAFLRAHKTTRAPLPSGRAPPALESGELRRRAAQLTG